MTREELLTLLWTIFIIEGDTKASVPFGWIKRKPEWKARKISFTKIMREVAKEIRLEWERWQKAKTKGDKRDFLQWLAQVGYNANPQEWRIWLKNAREVKRMIERL